MNSIVAKKVPCDNNFCHGFIDMHQALRYDSSLMKTSVITAGIGMERIKGEHLRLFSLIFMTFLFLALQCSSFAQDKNIEYDSVPRKTGPWVLLPLLKTRM